MKSRVLHSHSRQTRFACPLSCRASYPTLSSCNLPPLRLPAARSFSSGCADSFRAASLCVTVHLVISVCFDPKPIWTFKRRICAGCHHKLRAENDYIILPTDPTKYHHWKSNCQSTYQCTGPAGSPSESAIRLLIRNIYLHIIRIKHLIRDPEWTTVASI